jgi:two-component sensor histidine kinase
MNAIIPIDEHQRMLAVRRYDILDTPPDGAFDRITALAARRFNVPIAIISVVDTDRIWFKSHHGLPVEQIDRKAGLCASAILAQDPHILEDASTDIRSLANPLVAGDFGLRFYAGVPLQTSDGFNLGTLCVIDKEPRTVDQGQIDDLTDLASIVMDQLELRLSARNAVAQAKTLAQEIDHRVMNSLQFISSMLKMQSRSPRNDAACQLEVAANRVSTVARVHRHFSAGIVGDGTDCLPFIKRLCEDLSEVLGKTIVVDGDDEEVSAKTMQSVGLVVNELVTNAAKHGAGTITVSYVIRGDRRILSVSDEGDGLATGFDLKTAKTGLGIKVVGLLAKQLGGEFTASSGTQGRGSVFCVTFSA